jgi:hypothetical protein
MRRCSLRLVTLACPPDRIGRVALDKDEGAHGNVTVGFSALGNNGVSAAVTPLR